MGSRSYQENNENAAAEKDAADDAGTRHEDSSNSHLKAGVMCSLLTLVLFMSHGISFAVPCCLAGPNAKRPVGNLAAPTMAKSSKASAVKMKKPSAASMRRPRAATRKTPRTSAAHAMKRHGAAKALTNVTKEHPTAMKIKKPSTSTVVSPGRVSHPLAVINVEVSTVNRPRTPQLHRSRALDFVDESSSSASHPHVPTPTS